MNPLVIQRAYLDNCTIGKTFYEGQFVFYTLELAWRSNRPWLQDGDQASCIPPGEYALINHISERHGEVFALSNPNLGVTLRGPSVRTYVYIHKANFPHELRGCIAPGLDLHPEFWGVAKSALAFADLQRIRPERVLIK